MDNDKNQYNFGLKEFELYVEKSRHEYNNNQEDEKSAVDYLNCFYDLVKNRVHLNAPTSVQKKIINEVQSVCEKHLEHETIPQFCLVILEILASDNNDRSVLEKISKVAGLVYKEYSAEKLVAVLYTNILLNLSRVQKNKSELQENTEKARQVFTKYSTNEGVGLNYILILTELSYVQSTVSELQVISDEACRVYDKHSNVENVPLAYIVILAKLARLVEKESLLKSICDKARNICKNNESVPIIVENYAMILSELIAIQSSSQELEKNKDEAKEIYENNKKSQVIFFVYSASLYYLSMLQNDLTELMRTKLEAESLYNHNFDSSDTYYSELAALTYSRVLHSLSMILENKEDIEGVMKKAKSIYEKHSKLDNIVEYYINILAILSLFQKTEPELEKTQSEADKVYETHKNLPNVAISYSYILINCLEKQKEISQSEEYLLKINKLLRVCTSKELDRVVSIIDNIFYSSNILSNNKVPSKWFEDLIRFDLLKKTKYSVLIDIVNRNSSVVKSEQLIELYRLVQRVKYELAVKKLPDEFGHYTRGSVLQILLKQENNISNGKQYEIKGRTRLYNVSYMNDPEEGKILDKFLDLDKSFNFKNVVSSSPWFLMSLTTVIDELTMWSQYGDNAEGVCLLFKPDSFLEVNSIGDVEWLTQKDFTSNYKQEVEEKVSSMNSKGYFNRIRHLDESTKNVPSVNSKDYLYRICYLDEYALEKGKLIINPDKNKSLSNSEIESIQSSLKGIFSILLKLEEEEKSSEFINDINNLLEEIRYLFKSTAYSYEKELRILKYSELKPNNKKIMIHNIDPAAKLYIERDMPVQLKSIIFGPKFKEPENVTPLVHLLDKDIICKRSSQKFK